MVWWYIVLAGAIFAILLAFLLLFTCLKVPQDIKERDVKYWIYVKRVIYRATGYIGHYLGLGHILTTYRVVQKMFPEAVSVVDYTGIKTRDEVFNGVPVRIYEPTERMTPGAGLVMIHGGGWVSGQIASYEPLATVIARRLGILIVNIGYRLAPEHPFPAAFEDCEKATVYFMENADRFGVNNTRVSIMGSSAGGNLAAAVALKFRDDKKPFKLENQILHVPCLQALDFNTPSYQLNSRDSFLPKYWMINYWLWYGFGPKGHKLERTASDNRHVSAEGKRSQYGKFVDHDLIHKKYLHTAYIPNTIREGDVSLWEKSSAVLLNPYFAPLMAEDLKGLPATYIQTCQYDVLRDDGIMYARRLQHAGVKVIHQHYETSFHATDNSAGIISYLSTHL